MEQSTSSERLDSREGNLSLKEFLLKLYNETFLYDNRSTIKDLKGVAYEPEIVLQEDVYSNTEGYESSVESTDESTNQDGHISSSLDNKPTPAPLSTEDKDLNLGLVHPVAPVFNEITSQLPLFATYRVFTVHKIKPHYMF
jgi:hypothetical protein